MSCVINTCNRVRRALSPDSRTNDDKVEIARVPSTNLRNKQTTPHCRTPPSPGPEPPRFPRVKLHVGGLKESDEPKLSSSNMAPHLDHYNTPDTAKLCSNTPCQAIKTLMMTELRRSPPFQMKNLSHLEPRRVHLKGLDEHDIKMPLPMWQNW